MTTGTTQKIWGPTRIDGDADGVEYQLPPRAVGGTCKNAVYFVKILATSSAAPHLQLHLYHGPDGDVWVKQSEVFAWTEVTSTPDVLDGDSDADSNGQLGEWIQPRLSIKVADEWALVEVYELLKPF